MLPMFAQYPALARELPFVSLGTYPTPVQRLEHLGAALGVEAVYVKREDLSGEAYGGNKVRKLEFVLAQAQRDGRKEVLTFGGTGSNHALATAIYAHQLGMRSISVLMPQPSSPGVRRSLLMSHRCGAELHLVDGPEDLSPAAERICAEHEDRLGMAPMVIPTGGSSVLGTVGSVSAAFELKAQIDAGDMPVPDAVYVALGSMGTAMGLLLGLRALRLPTEVVAVRVVRTSLANPAAMAALVRQTNDLLCSADPSFPVVPFTEQDAVMREGYFGEGYAIPTPGGSEAVEMIARTEGIGLENTYTGKTLAALVDDARSGGLEDKTVLFWDSYNYRSFDDLIADVDYRELPEEFHTYFEEGR